MITGSEAAVSVRRKVSGRPRLSDDRRRTERLDVRVSPAEVAVVKERAASSRRTVARYVREVALGRKVEAVPAVSVAAAAQLGRIGNNLNQAVRLAHEGRLAVAGLSRDDLAALLKHLYELCSELGARLNGAPTKTHQDDTEAGLIPWDSPEGEQFKRDLAVIARALNEQRQL